MIALIQRVSRSSVTIEGEKIAQIGPGMTILLGVLKGDEKKDIDKLVAKIPYLRIFSDESGKMNRSLLDIGGEALVVSQFTLAGSVKKGRRPSFDSAMEPNQAKKLYERFCRALQAAGVTVKTGRFGAMMKVEIINDGPVTFIVDSREL